VIPRISRRSVRGTLKLGPKPVTSGTPTGETGDSFESTYSSMQQARKAEPVRMSDARYAAWNIAGKVKHIFGWHTYVPLEEWSIGDGSMRYIGMVCWHCQERLG
jgi:hypothetical protein